MNTEQEFTPVNSFSFEGKEQPVSFIETTHITDGVECDVYKFDGDPGKDLGIIRIAPGSKTPLQKVLKGERTVEGSISGEGKLTVTAVDSKEKVHRVDKETKEPFSVTVAIGELMQWEADADADGNLIAYEICFPPYEDGRYENIAQN